MWLWQLSMQQAGTDHTVAAHARFWPASIFCCYCVATRVGWVNTIFLPSLKGRLITSQGRLTTTQ